jgi:UDP-glucose 4-epimerase
MKTIAVSGASGFIGRWFLKLHSEHYRIVALSRRAVKSRPPAQGSVEYVQTDYSAASLAGVLKGCEALVHLAAKKVEPGRPETFDDYAQNPLLTERLLYACRDCGITNFVNMSSRCVYGPGNRLPFDEGQLVEPINMYGVSKAAGESICEYCNRYFGMRAKSLRLAQVVGGLSGGVFDVYVRNAANGRELNVFGRSKGKRDYIYVKDVCNAIACAIEQPEKKGVYNVASGVGVSTMELARAVCAAFGHEGGIRALPHRPEDESVIFLDTKKARRELSFACEFSLEATLSDIKQMLNSGDLKL